MGGRVGLKFATSLDAVSVQDKIRRDVGGRGVGVGESYVTTIQTNQHYQVPFLPWNMQLQTSSGASLDFSMFPFQREWYEDDIVYRRFVMWMKSTQVGVSEYGVRWSLFFPDKHSDRALYVFPALRQLRDFSDERVRPLVRSGYLRQRIPRESVDNKFLKDVGNGKWYARGSKNATDLDSIPASVLCLDEYDDLVMENIPRAEKRLSSPLARGYIRRFGVPRYSDLGIHAEYEKSDQRRWHVKCGACGEEAPLHFYMQDEEPHHFVDEEQAAIICVNCEKPIRPEWVAAGRWVAKYPDRDYIGYHVSRLVVPSAVIPEIIAESKRTKEFEIQEFWNSTLGLPYDPVSGRLSLQAIQAATRDFYIGPWDSGYGGDRLVTAGVDVASSRNLNVRVSEHLGPYEKRALWIGEVEDFDQLAILMEAFRVKLMMIDNLPDGRLARQMVNRFPGRAFVVSWNDAQRDPFTVDAEMSHVTVRRTETISATLDMIRQQLNLLPQNPPENYTRHMRAAVKKKEEDDRGRVRVFYETKTDHDYLQAEAYDLVATETFYWLQEVQGATRETFTRLEDVHPFERSNLGGIQAGEYSPGVTSDEETWPSEIEGEDPFGEFRDW